MSVSVSVIIPVYNTGQYLEQCIGSVLKQDFESFEIIAVNDGSTDNSLEILNGFAEKDDRVKPVTQENMGQGEAKNTGIKNAVGDYFLFLDSDDSIKEGTLKSVYDEAVKNDADIVWFGRESVDENGNSLGAKVIHNGPVKVICREDNPLLFADDSFITNKLIKSSLFTQNNIFYPARAWYEDFRILAKVFLKAEKIVLMEDCFYNYLIRSNSIMHVPNTDRNVEMIEAIEDINDYYRQNNLFDKYYEVLEYTAALHIMVFASLRVASIDPKHPLLERFYEYTSKTFPNFKNNSLINEHFTKRHKLIFEFSKRKMYRMMYLLNKLNNLR